MRLQGIAEGTSNAQRLANSSSTSFAGRNECPRIHCSLIVQEERKDSSCHICQRLRQKERLRRGQSESQRKEKRNGRLVYAAEISEKLAERPRLQQKNLNILGLAKKKGRLQCRKVSSWQDARAVFAKGKRNTAISPEFQIVRWERVEVIESCTLARMRSERDHGEKRVDSTVKADAKEEREGVKRKPP